MADRPIIFSAPMVRALLAGTKTQTRRELDAFCDEPPAYVEDGVIKALDPDDRSYRWPRTHAVGDRLWVREAWRTFSTFDDEQPRNLDFVRVWYEADAGYKPKIRYPHGRGRYRHGRFMPRWFSRLTLTVTDVRVERLQDISEADAIAEGVKTWVAALAGDPKVSVADVEAMISRTGEGSMRAGYAALWEAINGPGTWEANPWVAVYTFTGCPAEHRRRSTAMSTTRIAQRIATLAARRRRLAEDYRIARRRHRGAAKAQAALRKATHAQLEAELRMARAAPLRRAERAQRQAAPDLFQGALL